MLVRKLKGK